MFVDLKKTIYVNHLHTVDALKNAMTNEIYNITVTELNKVFNENLDSCINMCLVNQSLHFEQLFQINVSIFEWFISLLICLKQYLRVLIH